MPRAKNPKQERYAEKAEPPPFPEGTIEFYAPRRTEHRAMIKSLKKAPKMKTEKAGFEHE